MAKRKERNMSGTFIASYEGQTLGPFTGRQAAIEAIKKIMPDPTEKTADIYHRVCQVKVKNLEVEGEKEQASADTSGNEDVSLVATEHSEGVLANRAL
jgi:hypothetical protein